MFITGETIKLPQSGATVHITEVGLHHMCATNLATGAELRLVLTSHDYNELLQTDSVEGTVTATPDLRDPERTVYFLPDGTEVKTKRYPLQRQWFINRRMSSATKVWKLVHNL